MDYYMQALDIARETGDKLALAVYLVNIAETLIGGDEIDEAVPYLTEALSLAVRLGLTGSILFSIHLIGWMKIVTGHKNQGLELLGLTYYHPASANVIKRNVQEKLAFVGLEVDDPEVVEALVNGNELDLDTVAAEFLDELDNMT